MYHQRNTRKKYKSFPKPTTCQFCDLSQVKNILEETTHALIIENRVHYDTWEIRRVTDHLLVIPRRHVPSLQDLTDVERLDIMKLLGKYEAQGYNVYARSLGSVGRSIAHQHTHLIKTDDKKGKVMLFIQKPYWVVRF